MAKVHRVVTKRVKYIMPDFSIFARVLKDDFGRHFIHLIRRAALLAGARKVISLAKKSVPVRTGALKKSLAVGRVNNYRGTVTFGARKPATSRLHLVEFGFVHTGGKQVPGKLFYTNALERESGAIRNAVFLAADKEWTKIGRIISGPFQGIPARYLRVLER